jgi:hypothetical protein
MFTQFAQVPFCHGEGDIQLREEWCIWVKSSIDDLGQKSLETTDVCICLSHLFYTWVLQVSGLLACKNM